MPDHPSLVSDHHGLHPLPDPSVAGPDPFEPCEVEVEIAGTWPRGRAQARRRVDQRWEVQVSSLIDTGQPGALAGDWFGSNRIRAVHVDVAATGTRGTPDLP
jgi:hypothetical protein